jgi:hypothetical protein
VFVISVFEKAEGFTPMLTQALIPEVHVRVAALAAFQL